MTMIGNDSTEKDVPVQICIHCCNCFATAARFEACREKISEMKSLFHSITRLLRYQVAFCKFFLLEKNAFFNFLASLATRVHRSRMCLRVFGVHSSANATIPGGCYLAIIAAFVSL